MQLSFQATGAHAPAQVATPHLALGLAIEAAAPANGTATQVRALALQVQLRLEVARVTYDEASARALEDLFGPRERWPETQHSLLWASLHLAVPAFTDRTRVELLVPCSLDFDLAVTRYFAALTDGVVPVRLLFAGTVFHTGPAGGLQASPIPREAETELALPVAVWQEMTARHHPERAFLPVRRELLARLLRYRSTRATPTWDRALEDLLAAAEVSP